MGKGPRWIVRRNNPILNVPAILDIPNTVNRVLSRGIIYGDELFRKDDRYCSCFEVVLMELLYISFMCATDTRNTRGMAMKKTIMRRVTSFYCSAWREPRYGSRSVNDRTGKRERRRETIKSSMARILFQQMYICSPRSSCPREKRFTARYPVCSDVISIFLEKSRSLDKSGRDRTRPAAQAR